MSVSSYLQQYIIRIDHYVSMFLTAADVRLFHSAVCTVEIPSKLPSLFPYVQISTPSSNAEEISKQGMCRTYFPGKRAELFNCGYAILYGSADASKILKRVLNVLEWPASFLEKPS